MDENISQTPDEPVEPVAPEMPEEPPAAPEMPAEEPVVAEEAAAFAPEPEVPAAPEPPAPEVPPAPAPPAPPAPGYAPPTAPPPAYQAPVASSTDKNKVVAGILGILLGGLGIHKFYLGYQKEGIIMLVASIGLAIITFGTLAWVVSIVGLIEGIIYITKSDEEFYNIYVAGRKPWF